MGSLCAIYARKSNDQRLPDDEKSSPARSSAARPMPSARAGGSMPAHVYTDDGISGAEFRGAPASSG